MGRRILMPLTEEQRTAIALLANGATHADVAEVLGTTRATVGTWRARPDFASALEDQTRQVEEYASHRMRALGAVALQQLAAMATDPATPANARVRICEKLLELSQLRPADRTKDIADMDEADVVDLVVQLGPRIIEEAARRLEEASG